MSNQSGSAPQPQESAFEAAEAAAVRIGLFYHRMAGIGGVENYLLWTARGLRARHHEVTVACVEAVDALRAHYRDAGFDLAGMDALRGLDVVNVHNSPGWLDYLHLADAPPALLSIHEPPRDVYERDMDAHFLRSPINRERRPWTIWWDAMMRHSARREDQAAVRGYRRIVTDSDYIAGKVREIYGRGDATKLPFGLEEGPLQSDQASLQPPGYFLTVTRLTIVKNVQTAIEAVRGLPGARLVVAGAGDERARLEAQAKGAPVTFVGPVDEAEKATLLRDCRAVVYIPMDEPFGLVALEGSLVGKPVVASNHGGLPEIVDHEKTGFLVPPGDVQAVRTAMGRLLQDGALAEGLGRAGQESVRHRYAPGAYVEKLEQVLAEVAAA